MNKRELEQRLLARFLATGYVRSADPEKRRQDGRRYRKGYEVRIVLEAAADVRRVRAWAEALGLRAGSSYAKHNRLVLPFYGKATYDWFLARLPRGFKRWDVGFARDGRRLVRRSRIRGA